MNPLHFIPFLLVGVRSMPFISPLMLDMNKDGTIKARTDVGIVLESWSKSRASATGGDYMLAMCDFGSHPGIDLGEVFGNETKDPFDPKHPSLKTPNGFVALQVIGNIAQIKYPDLKIYEVIPDTKEIRVNLGPLKEALKKNGCDLGLVADDNITKLEPLKDVASVIVTDYYNTPYHADPKTGVSNRQRGKYITTSGAKYDIDDLWFPVV
jgi:hypothetical protein